MPFIVKPKTDKDAVISVQRNPFSQGYLSSIANFGTGITVYNLFSANTLYLNTLSGSTNITVYSGAGGVIITELKSGITVNQITGYTYFSGVTPFDQIFVTSGRSLCTTYPIFKQKTGSVLEFFGLSAGTNVTITTGNCITISATGGGGTGATTPTYVQPGTNTFTGGTSANPSVNITAATLASLTVSGGTSLAAVSGTSFFSGSTPFQSIFVTSGQSLDTSYPVFKQKVGSVLQFRGLKPGTNVSLSYNASSIYINSSPAGVYASNYFEYGVSGSQDLQRKNSSLYTNGKFAFNIGNNNNIQAGDYGFLGGQNSLIQYSTFAVSVGGNSNKTIGGSYNGILNGKSNYNYSWWGIITGGYRNKIKNYNDGYQANKSFIGNGYRNKIEAENGYTSPYASILNGSHNYITNSQHSTITGGKYNLIRNAKYSTVLSGNYNRQYGAYSLIGGKSNQNNGYYSMVFGNQCQNLGAVSFITGTYNVNRYGQSSVMLGGMSNRNYSSNHFAIIAGKNNTGSTAQYSIIGAGAFNLMTDTATYGMIAAGEKNKITNRHCFIGGGSGNTLTIGQRSAIIAGINNSGSSVNSVIVGGVNNEIRIGGNNNSIIGGSGNVVYQGLDNISIIAMRNYTAQTPNRVYVPSLRVNDLTGVTGYQMVIANTDGVLLLTGITAGGGSTGTTNNYYVTSGITTNVQPGTNTFTGGTALNPTVNITGGTFGNITATGITYVNTLSGLSISATTFYSGSTLLSSLLGGGGGEVNTASNLGTGTGVFAQKSGVDLQFKGLSAGTNIILTANSNTVVVSSTFDVSAYRHTSPAGGTGPNLERWYNQCTTTTTYTSNSITNNVITAAPFIVGKTGMTIDAMGFEVTTSGTAVNYIAIYDSTPNSLPNNLIFPTLANPFSASSSVAQVNKFTGSTIFLQPGLYFLAFTQNVAGGAFYRGCSLGVPTVCGYAPTFGTNNGCAWQHGNTPIPPAVFPTSALTVSTGTIIIGVRSI